MPRLTQQDFERLLEFRVTLRRFQRWSEDQAQAEGLTHVQHQLLVAIKGHPGNLPPSVGDLAGYLLLRPHSTVELVDRAEAAGLVERTPDGSDGRVVRVHLTREGDRILQKLTQAHLDRLHELATVLDELVEFRRGSDRPTALPIRRSARFSRGARPIAILPSSAFTTLNSCTVTRKRQACACRNLISRCDISIRTAFP